MADKFVDEVRRVILAVWLRQVNDVKGRPAFVCRYCSVAGSHLDDCLVAETLDRIAALPRGQSR